MKVSIDLPQFLMKKAMKVSGVQTKKDAVIIALQELIRIQKIRAKLSRHFRRTRGSATVKLTTNDVMRLTRAEK